MFSDKWIMTTGYNFHVLIALHHTKQHEGRKECMAALGLDTPSLRALQK